MDIKKSIEADIKSIVDNEPKLYSYLYDLIYEEKCGDITFLEKIFRSFLKDERSEIRRISLYALLFGLKLTKEEYKEAAIKNIIDNSGDFDLRLTCISSLSEAFKSSKDKDLLLIFSSILKNEKEDSDLRSQAFIGIMKLLSLSTQEIARSNNNRIIVGFEDIDFSKFEVKLQEVCNILKIDKNYFTHLIN